MTSSPASHTTTFAERTFAERLSPPWWWWPVGLGLALLVAAEVHGGAGGLLAVLPYAVCLPGAVLVMMLASRGRVRLGADGVLHVPGARIDVSHLAGGTAYDRRSVRALLRGADPLAFTATRPFIGSGVHLEIDDPEDDTPYWLVSSRRPADLLTAIAAARRSPTQAS